MIIARESRAIFETQVLILSKPGKLKGLAYEKDSLSSADSIKALSSLKKFCKRIIIVSSWGSDAAQLSE